LLLTCCPLNSELRLPDCSNCSPAAPRISVLLQAVTAVTAVTTIASSTPIAAALLLLRLPLYIIQRLAVASLIFSPTVASLILNIRFADREFLSVFRTCPSYCCSSAPFFKCIVRSRKPSYFPVLPRNCIFSLFSVIPNLSSTPTEEAVALLRWLLPPIHTAHSKPSKPNLPQTTHIISRPPPQRHNTYQQAQEQPSTSSLPRPQLENTSLLLSRSTGTRKIATTREIRLVLASCRLRRPIYAHHSHTHLNSTATTSGGTYSCAPFPSPIPPSTGRSISSSKVRF
jgi:hypothetical protein